MNISQPVASSIGSVDFGFLSSTEIKALSVKRIQNPTTFDTLLHPIPGGLYDPALGAIEDTPCSTCKLNGHVCPGHAGHIDLPVPCYHPIFMDQALRLLRAKCTYCHRLKMSRMEVNRFTCKLRLIQHGLLRQVQEIEQIHLTPKPPKEKLGEDEQEGEDVDTDDSNSEQANDIIRRRLTFVRDAIRTARSNKEVRGSIKNEAVAEDRRAVIKEFMGGITRGKKCTNCDGICPTYRKDKYVKIFEKGLNQRDYTKMVQGGFKMTNAMVILAKQRQARQKSKDDAMDIDEGIVADLGSSEGEDEERRDEQDEQDEQDEDSDEGSDIVMADATDASKSASKVASKSGIQRFVNCGEVHAALTLLFENEQEILSLVYNSRVRPKSSPPVNADMLFVHTLLVPPNKYRPQARTGDGEVAEAQQNSLYKQILTQCEVINYIHHDITARGSDAAGDEGGRKRDFNDLQEAWVRLQDAVNSLIDRDRNPVQGAAGKQNEEGIKQKLEKKEGLFRKNMMGKRVNFAARSVISPDPNIETNQIGVPPVFAKKLTYPEPVTNYNFLELKVAVENGVDKWPGATAIENENGQVISLRTKNKEERQALANQLLAPSSTNVTGARNKKVHRHLTNNDVVLMNRQPTLHKPSIMGHRAKVLPGEKTIRMHYANCKTYNADFDGDEMNMHFPQNEIARAEASHIADTDHQYLVATNGEPLRGLIQDHISMGVWMTNKDTFFDRDDYQQLVYSCLRPEDKHTTTERILTVTPAILKPRPMWTGKQIVSTILKNIKPHEYPGLTLTSKSTTAADRWGDHSEEGEVIFKNGEMICGILDKAQLGPSNGGLIHSVYEVYGHVIAGKLLSVFGRLLTKFLHMRAFSCGMDDLVLTKKGDEARRAKIKEADRIGLEVAAKYVTLTDQKPTANNAELRTRLEDVSRDEDKQKGLDLVTNSTTNVLSSEITKACLPSGLVKPFPKNQMQTMTGSGAKGSVVNANLISCNLGQQVLEGRRVPTMISGKTLPCFRPYETNVRAGGYIADRFLTGIRPQEYFFHCMAGREGLIDTAVKTSRSGYLQRCLIKGMEGLKVEYDDTVRDSDGSMVQFLYGEDGLDVTKQKHLTDFRFMAENFFSHFEQLNMREDFQRLATDVAMDWNKAAMKKVRRTGQIDAMDPVLARYQPSVYPYSTSEKFTSALKAYMDANPERLLDDKKKGHKGVTNRRAFETLMSLKYMKSVVEAGEAVGIIAGQSVGEPSTQMTLNTFHLAGHSAKNVTLGIPRLREIVMTASNHIATPSMTLYLNPELSKDDGERFAKVISRLSLGEIIDRASVSERIDRGHAYGRAKIYDVRIEFYPAHEYGEQYAITAEDVVRTLETKFVPMLQRMTRAELKKKGEESSLKGAVGRKSDAVPDVGRSSGAVEESTARGDADLEGGRDDEEEDGDDGDATNTKQRANRSEAISYEAPDEEEAALAAQARRAASPDADVEADMEDEGIGGSPRRASSASTGESDDDGRSSGTRTAIGIPTSTTRTPFAQRRASRIMSKSDDVTAFDFDDANGSWCTVRLEYDATSAKLLVLPLVELACHKTIVQSVHGLGACTLSTEKAPRSSSSDPPADIPIVVTEGVNLRAMHEYPHILNPNLLATNDIAAMLSTYGVEAARATIVQEIGSVFRGHHISVNNRHLNLIADMMTRGGGFAPFNRIGLRTNVSPFAKMSFETTVGFLREAVLEGDWDELSGPSGRIVVGKVGGGGTGGMDVLMKVSE